MNSLKVCIKEFCIHEEGPTATEYAVVLAMLVIGALGALILLGERLQSAFSMASTETE